MQFVRTRNQSHKRIDAFWTGMKTKPPLSTVWSSNTIILKSNCCTLIQRENDVNTVGTVRVQYGTEFTKWSAHFNPNWKRPKTRIKVRVVWNQSHKTIWGYPASYKRNCFENQHDIKIYTYPIYPLPNWIWSITAYARTSNGRGAGILIIFLNVYSGLPYDIKQKSVSRWRSSRHTQEC